MKYLERCFSQFFWEVRLSVAPHWTAYPRKTVALISYMQFTNLFSRIASLSQADSAIILTFASDSAFRHLGPTRPRSHALYLARTQMICLSILNTVSIFWFALQESYGCERLKYNGMVDS